MNGWNADRKDQLVWTQCVFEFSESSSRIEHTTQTVSTMTSLFVVLTLFPEVQKRAQAQIDSVTSSERLPTFEDRLRLPYIEAICKELLRWQLVLPLGASSALWCELTYLNNFLKGSLMLQPRIVSIVGSLFQKVYLVIGQSICES